ncbi:hypothetical protein CDAR_68721 [Caerostris darwini]|uniref:Uncharacterized protein n=1 Tax=Caerostris darwini TaxID=1538125 RepID=A0AAV4WWB0_9ARAC|nr:hypothetical protein CDAR_68721 [Caerostris darwini]
MVNFPICNTVPTLVSHIYETIPNVVACNTSSLHLVHCYHPTKRPFPKHVLLCAIERVSNGGRISLVTIMDYITSLCIHSFRLRKTVEPKKPLSLGLLAKFIETGRVASVLEHQMHRRNWLTRSVYLVGGGVER